MPPSIPFLRLPNVPQLLILEYLSLYQLFDFSLLSKRASEIAKSRKRNIKKFHWYANYIIGKFILRITDYKDKDFTICIPLDRRILGVYMIIVGEITFEGKKLRTARNGRRYMYIGEEDQPHLERLELIDNLTAHSLAMLNVENYSLDVIGADDLTKCSILKHTKTLEKLHVEFGFERDVLTARDMEFILGELTVTGELIIEPRVAQGFQWTKPLKTEKICLHDGHFLSLDVYLNSEVKEWTIRYNTLPTAHLNAIMKKWLDGGLDQLKRIQMDVSWTEEERKLNEALEGIQTFPWDRMTRQRWWGLRDTSKGRDMRRSDGKLATAGVRFDQFCFFVWNSDQLQPESDSSEEDLEEDDEENVEEDVEEDDEEDVEEDEHRPYYGKR